MPSHRFDLTVIGKGLVVAKSRSALEQELRGGTMVVTAPPGTGKTTFLPPLVANAASVRGRVLLSQPRRVAARAAARRIAQLDGSKVGEHVGFTVRGERQVSGMTRIEAVTPGVLLRRLLADPGLDGVGAVILDEIHERTVDGDLLLALLAEVRQLREDLVVVAMSATAEAELVAEVLGAAPIVRIPSALHPLSIEYAPYVGGTRLDERGVTRQYLRHLADTAASAQATHGVDTLVFVPGAREVDEVRAMIAEMVSDRAGSARVPEVLTLHGRVASREQDRIVQGRDSGAPHRIIVSTSLAESALTIPGVRLVVDSGLSRELRRDQQRQMSGLVTVSASRSNATQREGRAARQGPGTAIRAYSETDYAHMPLQSQPEITSADLLDFALTAASWGSPGARSLPLPTIPPAENMEAAERALHALGLVTAEGLVTELGSRVARLPVGAREARALLLGTEEFGASRFVSEAVAALSENFRAADSDLERLLRELRGGHLPGSHRWRQEARRLEALVAPQTRQRLEPIAQSSRLTAGSVIALARPEWIARRVSEHSRQYLFASGTRAALPEQSGLRESEWISVAEVQLVRGRAADGTGALIRLAAALTEGSARHYGAALIHQLRSARVVNNQVRVSQREELGMIRLSSTQVRPSLDEVRQAVLAHFGTEGLHGLRWGESARHLRSRLSLLHLHLGAPWPDVSDSALLAELENWLFPELESFSPDQSLDSIQLENALRRLLPWPEAAQLDELAPESVSVPSGSRVRIDYPATADEHSQPTVSVKLQEVFGLAESPRLLGGRLAIRFHLLSPARRPLAVTDDLASFWNGAYRDVRAQMRGRYPKHPWPEDPWSAKATARTKRGIRR